MPIQDRSASGRLNVMMNDVSGERLKAIMNDVGDIGLGFDVSFICRSCKWEQAQNAIIERLVSVEKLGIKLTEESADRNDRLDRMEEINRRLVELINEIDSQMLQESVRLSIRATSKMRK